MLFKTWSDANAVHADEETVIPWLTAVTKQLADLEAESKRHNASKSKKRSRR
jgi:hypothetical protein